MTKDAIQAVLHSLGIPITDDEAERLGSPLRAILADLQKLDELEAAMKDPTPRFTVEEEK